MQDVSIGPPNWREKAKEAREIEILRARDRKRKIQTALKALLAVLGFAFVACVLARGLEGGVALAGPLFGPPFVIIFIIYHWLDR